MKVAEEKFDIPQVMDPKDIIETPDAKSVMTYVSYFQQKVNMDRTFFPLLFLFLCLMKQ